MPQEGSQHNSPQTILKYAGMIMSLLYIVTGAVVIWKSQELFNIPGQYAPPVGSLLIAYGLFRAYRIYLKHYKQ